MKLWDRIQRGMEAGFDAAISAVHVITERGGEGVETIRLRREKARIETELTRRLAELGNGVYEKILTERLDDLAEKLGIKNMVLEIAESDAQMIDIDRRLKKELNKTEEKKG
ncbi:MAG: hypothetical protein KJ630_20815 [Proteobacteria bacterium]|nr:hypothetical protein [Pseudomonadota bacterium]